MGLFGGLALVVNVAAVLVLVPHRSRNANVRAVWHFSGNDATGGLAVIAAAGVVAWKAAPRPDLIVAFVITGLFLQSSWTIVHEAREQS